MSSPSTKLGRDARRSADDGRDLQHDAGRIVDHLRQSAPELARKARELLEEHFGEVGEQVRHQGRDVAAAAGDQLEDARAFMVDRVQERPLTATFAALGIGFLVGLLISGSRR